LDENHSLCEAALETCKEFDLIDGVYSDDPADAADLIRVRIAQPTRSATGVGSLQKPTESNVASSG
jgi:glycolate oxidase